MSTIVPTDKSTMRLKLLVPMPRIRILRPASLVFSVKVKPGTSRCRSVICVLLQIRQFNTAHHGNRDRHILQALGCASGR